MRIKNFFLTVLRTCRQGGYFRLNYKSLRNTKCGLISLPEGRVFSNCSTCTCNSEFTTRNAKNGDENTQGWILFSLSTCSRTPISITPKAYMRIPKANTRIRLAYFTLKSNDPFSLKHADTSYLQNFLQL